MRTLTETPSGQSSSRSARCAATAPAAASRARVKEKKNASPCVSISCPPAEPSVSRRMLRSRPRTSELPVAELAQQSGRPFDVGEQECHRPAWEQAHGAEYEREPPGRRDEPLPPAARRQSCRLVSVG